MTAMARAGLLTCAFGIMAMMPGCLSLDDVAAQTRATLIGRSRAAVLACAGVPVRDLRDDDGGETLVYAGRTRITLPNPSVPPDWQPYEPGNPRFYPDEGRISADFPCTARVGLHDGQVAGVDFAPNSAPRQCREMFHACRATSDVTK
jgi:hypothetical protein